MHTARGRILIAFAIVYLVWGSTYLAIRLSVETIPPFLLAASRCLVAGSLLYALVRLRDRKVGRPAPTLKEWGGSAVMGFLMFVLGNSILSWAETRIDSGLAALLVGAIPLWVVILERIKPFGTRREITIQKALGVGLGLLGLGMLVWPGNSGSGVRFDLFTAGILTVGAIAWAIGTVAGPVIPHPADKIEGAAMTMLTGGVMIALVALVRGEFSSFQIGLVSVKSIAAWAYLVVFGSMIAYTAYSYLVSTVEAGKIATYALVNPIVAVFLGWALVGERVTPKMLTATAVIVAGLALTLFGGEAAAWTGRALGRSGAGALAGLGAKAPFSNPEVR